MLPSRLREGPGVGKVRLMPEWKPRNTDRARTLRRAATPAERTLWQHLSRRQLGVRFSRQMPLGPFFADFLCRDLKLVIECDGVSHDRAPEADARRDAWMQAEGYAVMRLTNTDVLRNAEGVVTMIREEVARLQALQTHP